MCEEQRGEGSSACDEQRGKRCAEASSVYGMSRVRGRDIQYCTVLYVVSNGERRAVHVNEQRGKRCAEGSSSVRYVMSS
jgi:hypothetical protein